MVDMLAESMAANLVGGWVVMKVEKWAESRVVYLVGSMAELSGIYSVDLKAKWWVASMVER